MKLTHIFEATHRGQQGGTPPETYDYHEATKQLSGDFTVEDVTVKDPATGVSYETAVSIEIGSVDHQAPHGGSAWSVDSDVDYYGYTDVEWEIIEWVRIHDEDAEECEVVKGTVDIDDATSDRINELAEKHALDSMSDY